METNLYNFVESMRDSALSAMAFHQKMYNAFTAFLNKMEAEAGYQNQDEMLRSVPWDKFVIELMRDIAPSAKRMNDIGLCDVNLDDIMRVFLFLSSDERKLAFDTRVAKTGIDYAFRKMRDESSDEESDELDCESCENFHECFPYADTRNGGGVNQNEVVQRIAGLMQALGMDNANVIVIRGVE